MSHGELRFMRFTIMPLSDGPEPVTLLPPGTQYTVTEGNNIPPINCTADCRPACNYTWFGPKVPNGTSNILSLQNIQKKQRGVYNCMAYNDVDSFKSSDVNINVHFGPELSLQFQPSNNSLTKNKGDMLGPHICSATCNPPCKYIWTTPDKTTINAAQLIVPSLSIMDHGQFICTASNGIDGSQNKSLYVSVNCKY
ncbi:unnamed protein product [Mytilus coruscus]|uniref:Ig-like domain-containing protein n=1 Tax=Mytilus coruscus TaxID=42192 RepID=A0A6J8BAM4_MYTCO|nr:unnamed protein product [Mytilus coruscus]